MLKKFVLSLVMLFTTLFICSQSWQELDSLTELYFEKAKYDSALIFSDLALKTVEENFSTEDTLYANMLARQSLVQYFLGSYEESIKNLLQEKEIREKKQDNSHVGYGRLLNDLGVNYESLGDYEKAEYYYTLCLQIAKITIGEKHSDYAILCSNIAVFYHITGAFQKAEHYYLLALKIQKETLGNQHPDYATTLNNLGVFYSENGNYKKAEQYHQEALNIRKDIFGEAHWEYTNSLNNLAVLYGNLGNYSKAEKLWLQIIQIEKEIYGNTHPDVTVRLRNLGIIYSEMGDYKKAIQYQSESLIIDEKNFGKKHRYYAMDLSNLAGNYFDLGQFEKAEQLYVESLNIIEKIFDKNHPDYSLGLYNLSSIYLKTGEYEKSEISALESLRIREKVLGEKHPDYLKSLIQLASIYIAMEDYEKAEPLVLKSIDQTSLNIYRNFSFLSDEEKELYLKTVSKRFDFFNSYALKRKSDNPAIANYISNNTLRNKALLLKSSTVMRQSILNGNDSLLINKYEKLIDLRKQLSKLYTMPIDERYMNTEKLEGKANKIEKELVQGSQLFDEYMRIQQYTWESVRDMLNDDEAAVDIIRFQNYDKTITDSVFYVAMIVTNQTKDHPDLVLLKNGSEFEEKYFAHYQNSVSQEKNKNNVGEDMDKICYQVFWEEIEKEIKNNDVVYFCPEGIYHKINLNTIICDDGSYLYEKKDIIILNSISELLEKKTLYTKGSGKALLIGNPNFNLDNKSQKQLAANLSSIVVDSSSYHVYNDFRDFSLSTLPGSQEEVEQIDILLRKHNWETQCLTGNQALEEAVKSANNLQILHLATHGFFADNINVDTMVQRGQERLFGQNVDKAIKNPMLRSGLMFCGSQKTLLGNYNPLYQIEDGILTGYEAMNLSLDSTELVVLSACETGLGEVLNGEGVYGLQRAFKIAGAQNIIMSLWKVNDEATQLLMRKFYEFWLDGYSKRKAFKMAQDFLRTKTDFNKSYYWGGFVYIGMDNSSEVKSINYWYFLGLILLVGLIYIYIRNRNFKSK